MDWQTTVTTAAEAVAPAASAAASRGITGMGLLIICIALVALVGGAFYFVPTIIACVRKHRNRVAIILLNVLAGWTFVGWLVALIWSVVNTKEKE